MNVKQKLLEAAASAGYGEHALSLYSAVSSWPDFIPEVDPDIRSYTLSDEEAVGTIFMPVVEGARNPYLHCLLAHAFRTRGYRPMLLLCDRDLPLCFNKDQPTDTVACDECRFHGTSVLDKFGLDPVSVGDYVGDTVPGDVIEAAPDRRDVTHRGIDVSGFALSSTRRFLKKHHLDLTADPDGAVYDSMLESAVLLTDVVSRLLDSRDDVVGSLGMDGAYIYGGLPQVIAAKHSIPVNNYCVGYTDGTLLVGNENVRSPMFTDPELIEEFLSTPLSDTQRDAIDEMMAGRRDGSQVRIKWSGDSSEDIDLGDGTVVSMFTNLMWDASLEVEHDAAFEGAYEWIETTISELGGRDGVTLVLKPHPAESYRGTNESVVDWLDANYESIPENVVALDPDTHVGPYKLLSATDHALVWNSTIGLEAVYEGIPTIVSGVAHYRGYDFTFDAQGTAEYRSLLGGLDRDMTERMQARARRYAYFLFLAKQIEFPFFETIDGKRQLLPVTHDQLTPGNENIDTIVNGIINEETVYRAPHAPAAPQS